MRNLLKLSLTAVKKTLKIFISAFSTDIFLIIIVSPAYNGNVGIIPSPQIRMLLKPSKIPIRANAPTEIDKGKTNISSAKSNLGSFVKNRIKEDLDTEFTALVAKFDFNFFIVTFLNYRIYRINISKILINNTDKLPLSLV
jgi:hypothetical protein